jgi:hypothetical protein
MPNDEIAVEPRKPKKPSVPATPEVQGCPTSFLAEQKDEMGNVCKPSRPAPKEAYLQPDAEKESGGEG